MRIALICAVPCGTPFISCAQATDPDPDRFVDGPIPGLLGCVDGCSLWAREEFFRERGLEPGSCEVSAELHLSEAGEVTDLEIPRGEEGSACVRVMREWALSTRWEPSSENPDRHFVVGMYPAPRKEVASSEAQFRTYPIRTGDSVSHILLIHPDPDATLEAIWEEYRSGFGRVALVSEAHARRRTLCMAGRTSDGAIELQAVPVSGNAALSSVTPDMGPFELARVFHRMHPDQAFLAGDVLTEGGTCLLLQSLSSTASLLEESSS